MRHTGIVRARHLLGSARGGRKTADKRAARVWAVVAHWDDNGQTFSLIVKDKLTEIEAIDEMIAREKAYEGTGRTFSCYKPEAEV